MYVIYPADEIISLTYGIAAPRVHPRPTLDNLREPRVPVGTSFSTTTATSSSHLSLPRLGNGNAAAAAANVANIAPTGYDRSSISSRRPSLVRNTNLDAPPNNSRYELTTVRPESVSPALTDYSLSPSPPLLPLSLPGSPLPGAVATKPPPAAKKKSKLQMKLAKLGRPHSSPEQNESTRVLEYQDIIVSNPTFTRDNLRARNFDAFFESGEPVYSLEVKDKAAPVILEPDSSFDQYQLPPLPTYELPGPERPSRPKSRLNLFKRNKEPKTPSTPASPSSGGAFENFHDARSRSQSSDILLFVEEPQKGDRCTPLMIDRVQ